MISKLEDISYNLEDLSPQHLADAMPMFYHEPKYQELNRKREHAYQAKFRKGSNVLSSNILLRKMDDKMGRMLLEFLAERSNKNRRRTKKTLGMLLQDKLDNKELAQEDVRKYQELSLTTEKALFLADMLDSVLVDINALMKPLFGNVNAKYEGLDALSSSMKAFRTTFNVNNDNRTPEEQTLYTEYVESLEAFFQRRMKTYTAKRKKIQDELMANPRTRHILEKQGAFLYTPKT